MSPYTKNCFNALAKLCGSSVNGFLSFYERSMTMGKLSTSIIDYLLKKSDNSINHEEIASKLLRRLKSKKYAVIHFIEGF